MNKAQGKLYLPMQGGNIVLLTQLHWPTVHPCLQEERPSSRREDEVKPRSDSTTQSSIVMGPTARLWTRWGIFLAFWKAIGDLPIRVSVTFDSGEGLFRAMLFIEPEKDEVFYSTMFFSPQELQLMVARSQTLEATAQRMVGDFIEYTGV